MTNKKHCCRFPSSAFSDLELEGEVFLLFADGVDLEVLLADLLLAAVHARVQLADGPVLVGDHLVLVMNDT